MSLYKNVTQCCRILWKEEERTLLVIIVKERQHEMGLEEGYGRKKMLIVMRFETNSLCRGVMTINLLTLKANSAQPWYEPFLSIASQS